VRIELWQNIKARQIREIRHQSTDLGDGFQGFAGPADQGRLNRRNRHSLIRLGPGGCCQPEIRAKAAAAPDRRVSVAPSGWRHFAPRLQASAQAMASSSGHSGANT